MFLIDTNDGNILKKQHAVYKIDGNRYMNYYEKEGAFPSGLYFENIKDKYLDKETIFAIFLNPEVEKFLQNPGVLNYNTDLTTAGILMIEENSKTKEFRLLKFNWL